MLTYHIIKSTKKGWKVKKKGAKKASFTFHSKSLCIMKANKLITSNGSIIVHKENGQVACRWRIF